MKRVFCTLLLVCIVQLAKGQEYSFLEKGLKRISSEQLMGKPIKLSVPAFLHDGTKIKNRDVSGYLADPTLKLVFFGFEEGVLKALVFEKESAEQIERNRKMLESMSRVDPLLNQMAPEFTTTDLAGNEVQLSDYKGQVVVLNFWFIACKPCIIEMPELNKLVKEFEKDDVVFLAIGLEKEAEIKQFLTRKEFIYDILPDGRAIATDYDVNGFPTHLIVNKEGRVVFSQTGYSTNLKRQIKRRLKDLLKAK